MGLNIMTLTFACDEKKDMRTEIQEFADVCKKYYNGELSISEYKSISGGFGTYSERGHKTGMLRLRTPAGVLDSEKFKFLIDSIEKYNIQHKIILQCIDKIQT